MKKINARIALVSMDNKTLMENGSEISLGSLLSNLLAQDRSNPTLGWVLGKKFATEKEVDLKAEDIVYIKSVLEKLEVNALYGGQIIELLESSEEKLTKTQ